MEAGMGEHQLGSQKLLCRYINLTDDRMGIHEGGFQSVYQEGGYCLRYYCSAEAYGMKIPIVDVNLLG